MSVRALSLLSFVTAGLLFFSQGFLQKEKGGTTC